MRIKKEIIVEKELHVNYFRMVVPVRYEEEDVPNDFPFRKGNTWSVDIDIDKVAIEGWPEGYLLPEIDEDGVFAEANETGIFKMCMKVVDEGSYYLLDADKRVICHQLREYVPGCLPEQHFGDYIQLHIELATGKIVNWPAAEQFVCAVEKDTEWQLEAN